jgi:uroporphyrin-III C-methyltransferase
MLLDIDVSDLSVLVVGSLDETAAAVRRFERAGAVVTTAQRPAEVLSATRPLRLAVLVGRAREWPEAAMLRERCPVVEEDAATTRGRIVLVGAGPGGPGLLTIDAVAALADADVVLADRLAHVGDLAPLAPGAEIIDVGKRPGHHAVSQPEIEALMVDRATKGLTVVRLKGGDPFVFGRGGEEVATATAAGLPVSVIPGVTSAVAVPGAAGIPVTHRGISHVVSVISGHVPLTHGQAECLVGLGGTIVFLMGVHNLVPLTTALLSAGLPPETPAAVVERGLTPDMRSTLAPLAALADAAHQVAAASPAVVVVGEVVRLSDAWQDRAGERRAPRRKRATTGSGAQHLGGGVRHPLLTGASS